MKHLRVTSRPEPERAPAFFRVLADSEHVTAARAVDWNMAAPERTTLLYAVDGDPLPFREAALDTDGIESVELSAVDAPTSYALVRAETAAIPLFSAIAEAMARSGLVVRKPVVYRDGTARAHVVGDPAPLQAALDAAPPGVDVRVDEIGTYPCPRADPGTELSERQREAVETALELGYYDRPRGATHEDVADALGCAPATASDHLQKAEAKLVRAGTNEFGH